MRSHPEWFTAIEWWRNNPWASIHKDDWKKKSRQFFDKLSERGDQESLAALSLLRLLLPGIAGEGLLETKPSEERARRERRLLHPANYQRYFSLYIPASVITEAEVEDFADSVLAARPGVERQALVRDRLVEEVDRGRIDSFWNQWDLGFRFPLPLELSLTPPLELSLAEDLSLAIARASDRMSSHHRFFGVSDLNMGALKIARMVSLLATDDEVTHVLELVVHASARDFIPGYLIKLARDARKRERLFGERQPDLALLESAFNSRIGKVYGGTTGSLLDANRADLVAVIFWSTNLAQLTELLKRDLAARPKALPKLLALACPTGSDEGIMVEQFDPSILASRLPLEDLRELTDGIALDSWKDPLDRELAEKFRAWDPKAAGGSNSESDQD
jgi:hypothetical protein